MVARGGIIYNLFLAVNTLGSWSNCRAGLVINFLPDPMIIIREEAEFLGCLSAG